MEKNKLTRTQKKQVKIANKRKNSGNTNKIVREKQKLIFHANDYFFHATKLGGKKKLITKRFPDWYNGWDNFKVDPVTGFKFWVREEKQIDDTFDKNELTNQSQTKSKTRHLKRKRSSKLRKLKNWVIYSTMTVVFLMLIIFGCLGMSDNVGFDFYANVWFYVVSIGWWSLWYFYYTWRKNWFYANYHAKDLTYNINIMENEITNRIHTLLQNDKNKAPNYLSWNLYKQIAAKNLQKKTSLVTATDFDNNSNTRSTDNKATVAVPEADIRTFIFDPKIVMTDFGYRLDDNSRIPALGYVLTSFMVRTDVLMQGRNETEPEFIKRNGYVPETTWNTQKEDTYRIATNDSEVNSRAAYNEFVKSGEINHYAEALVVINRSHLVLLAGTGKGKSSFFMLPTVVAAMASTSKPIIFLNSKGEDEKYLYNWAVVCGYSILSLDFTDVGVGDKYNPYTHAWLEMFSHIAYEKNQIEYINITPDEYSQCLFFTIRYKTFKNQQLIHNVEYINKDLAFYRVKQFKNGKYFKRPSDIVNGIMELTNDTDLDIILKNNLIQQGLDKDINKLDINVAAKFILSNYDKDRNVNYTIGQIRRNYLIPAIYGNDIIATNITKNWFKPNGAFFKQKNWYLVGAYGFFNKEDITTYGKSLSQEWKNSSLTNAKTATFDMLTIDPNKPNDFWNTSGTSIFEGNVKGFLSGMLQYGSDLFAVEYFTGWNINNAFSMLQLGSDYVNLAMLPNNQKKEFENLSDNLQLITTMSAQQNGKQATSAYIKYDMATSGRLSGGSNFEGVSMGTSLTTDTWNGMLASMQTIVKNLQNPDIFTVTLFSTIDLVSVLYKPTLIISSAKEEGDIEPFAKLIVSVYNNLDKTILSFSKHNDRVSPRDLLSLLDEFAQIPWDKTTIIKQLTEGRSRHINVAIISQSMAQVLQIMGNDFQPILTQNTTTMLDLGEKEPQQASEVSKRLGTYTHYDYDRLSQQDKMTLYKEGQNAILDRLVKVETPWKTENELIKTKKGDLMGTIKTVNSDTTFFEFKNLLYYTSVMRYEIENNEQITPKIFDKETGKLVPNLKPKQSYIPEQKQYRFDFTIFWINNYIAGLNEFANELSTLTKDLDSLLTNATHGIAGNWTSDKQFNIDWFNSFPQNISISYQSNKELALKEEIMAENEIINQAYLRMQAQRQKAQQAAYAPENAAEIVAVINGDLHFRSYDLRNSIINNEINVMKE